MELFQVLWDDQSKLFLEFKKNEEEKQKFLPEKIKRLTIQFEISKFLKQELYHNNPPYLIAIKKLYHSSESLSFSIELDEMVNCNDLQIKISRLTIFLYSGQRFEYYLTENFKISDIWINEDCYDGFKYEDLTLKRSVTTKFTQKKVFQELKMSFHEIKEKRTIIYEKSKIEKITREDSLLSLISESNKTLSRIEQEIKKLSLSFQSAPHNNVQYLPSAPIAQRSELGIVRIKSPSKLTPIEGQISSSKLMVIKEMKSIFKTKMGANSSFNIKDFLKPLTEEELKTIMLDDEELEKKEEEAIKNQINRFKKQQEKELRLENLKSPK
ncbi:hypothetical protein LCGC14_1346990 [marine sediment metagenome]|uniref:Uncharacterized protein n=1 Tax=marine sediment metagenome TaxID=412755 RepID=A0A0F9KC27_9ZZZZ